MQNSLLMTNDFPIYQEPIYTFTDRIMAENVAKSEIPNTLYGNTYSIFIL